MLGSSKGRSGVGDKVKQTHERGGARGSSKRSGDARVKTLAGEGGGGGGGVGGGGALPVARKTVELSSILERAREKEVRDLDRRLAGKKMSSSAAKESSVVKVSARW